MKKNKKESSRAESSFNNLCRKKKNKLNKEKLKIKKNNIN